MMIDPALVSTILQEKDQFHKAKLIHQLRTQYKLTIKQLSDTLQIQPAYICHILRLLKLPSIVVDGYYSKMVSASHLYILARLKNHEEMISAYEQVLAKSLTSQATEELVREWLYGVTTNPDRLDREELKEYLRTLGNIYPDLEIKVVQTRIKGKIVLEIKGNSIITTKYLKELLDKLIRDESGVERITNKVFTLE